MSYMPTQQKNHKEMGTLATKSGRIPPLGQSMRSTIGPYTIKRDGQKPLTLWCLTAIDPATGWLEIFNIKTKRADLLINLLHANATKEPLRNGDTCHQKRQNTTPGTKYV